MCLNKSKTTKQITAVAKYTEKYILNYYASFRLEFLAEILFDGNNMRQN